MAKAAAGGGADSSVADQLRALGVKGVLVQMAIVLRDGRDIGQHSFTA